MPCDTMCRHTLCHDTLPTILEILALLFECVLFPSKSPSSKPKFKPATKSSPTGSLARILVEQNRRSPLPAGQSSAPPVEVDGRPICLRAYIFRNQPAYRTPRKTRHPAPAGPCQPLPGRLSFTDLFYKIKG